MDAKVCVITGATSGIGKETAKTLAASGWRVAMVARSQARGEAAAHQVRLDAPAGADVLLADLASLAAIRELSAEILSRYPRIDALVANAGVFRLRRKTSADGFEETFAVNHLAPFLLTNLLLGRLEASAPSRIVLVASAAHRGASIDFDDLQATRRYSAWRAYSRSKLGNIMFGFALARRLTGSDVTVNCIHPGFVRSNLGSGNGVPVKPFMTLMTPFTISPATAAHGVARLVTDPDLAGINGAYFERLRLTRPGRACLDEQAQERLWTASAALTGLGPG